MNNSNVVISLVTRENDYQREQANAAETVATRNGATVEIIYADNDAVVQTQQLLKVIQDPSLRPAAIVVEPVGTEMPQVAKAAVSAGIGWVMLNRTPDYISQLRTGPTPVFAIDIDQQEVGKIQARQLEALVEEGNVLYVEGPSGNNVTRMRSKGMLAAKPRRIELKVLKGDWTEQSGSRAVRNWLSLTTSKQMGIRAVVCQNDGMALGARKAFEELPMAERDHWLSLPFTGCDGLPKTGQDWVRRGQLRATVVTPTVAGLGLEMLLKVLRGGPMPPAQTMLTPVSFPPVADLRSSKPLAH